MAELIKREGNKVEFRVTVPQGDVQSAYSQVWSAVSRDVRIPGFRPGKAPRSVLEKRVGRGYIEGEVRERLLETFYPAAVRDLQLNLVDAEITPDSLREGGDFAFTVKGETYPSVTLPDWKNFTLSAESPQITEDVLERTLGDLRERNATFESAERPAEATDQVTLQELGEEGGTYPVYLDVAEEHVREALLGKSVGDEVIIEVPAHSHGDHEHAAQSVPVKIVDIKHKKLQNLDDEFAKSLNFDSIERLRADLRGELERRAQSEGDSARREQFVTQLVDGMSAEVPGAMIDRRQEAMLDEIKDDLSRQGVKWAEYETFMNEQGKLADFMADLRKNAESRVKRDLALEKLAEDTNIGLTQGEVDASLNALAQANRITVPELRAQLGEQGLNGYYASLARDKALALAVASLNAPNPNQQEATRQNADQQGERAPQQVQAQLTPPDTNEGQSMDEVRDEQGHAAALESNAPVQEVGSGEVAHGPATQEQTELTAQPIADLGNEADQEQTAQEVEAPTESAQASGESSEQVIAEATDSDAPVRDVTPGQENAQGEDKGE